MPMSWLFPWRNRSESSATPVDRQDLNAAEENEANAITSGAIPLPSSVVNSSGAPEGDVPVANGSNGYTWEAAGIGAFVGTHEYTAGSLILQEGVIYERATTGISAGNGTSGTDVWKLNGAALLTTSITSGSLHVNAVGEGYEYGSTALYAFTTPSPKGVSALPVVLSAAAEITTAVPMEIEIVWCLSPLSA